MTVQAATSGGRRAAAARMLDTFQIRVPVGEPAYDRGAKADVQVYDNLFVTIGRIKHAGVPTSAEVGGRTVVTTSRELHIPVDSPAVPDGAEAVVLTVDPSSDPTLAGAVLRVHGPAPGSQTTARRLQVEEVLT